MHPDLLGKVEKDGSTLANYSYLSDGTKLSVTDGNGKGLVYRGPFVYRKSSGSSSLTLESAAYSGGRVAPGRALLYVTDYLCRPRQLLLESPSATATPARKPRLLTSPPATPTSAQDSTAQPSAAG